MVLFLRLGFFLFLLILCACERSTNGTASLASTGCYTHTDPLRPPSLIPTSQPDPIEIDPRALGIKPSPKSAPFIQLNTTSDDFLIPKQSKLVVLVDQLCLEDKIKFKTESTLASRFPVFGNPKRIPSYAHQWELERDMYYSEVRALAKADRCVLALSHEMPLYTQSTQTNDQYFSTLTHLTGIKAPQAYDTFYGAQGITQDVVVAIVDDGVNHSHVDLIDNRWTNPREIAGNSTDDDGNGYTDDIFGYNIASNIADPDQQGATTHGTHVAGLAAARANNTIGTTGVIGKNVKIMGVNVFGNNASASVTDIINGINYAANNGAEVINMSLGGLFSSTTLRTALQNAVARGIVVVAAAGNNAEEITAGNFYSPVGYAKDIDGFLGIGSIDANNLTISSFSNYSTTYVELAAPGSDSVTVTGLLSTVPGGYGYKQGTSMASPVAAGAAAIAVSYLKSHGVSYTAKYIEDSLISASPSSSALTAYIKNGKRLDLQAVATLLSNAICN